MRNKNKIHTGAPKINARIYQCGSASKRPISVQDTTKQANEIMAISNPCCQIKLFTFSINFFISLKLKKWRLLDSPPPNQNISKSQPKHCAKIYKIFQIMINFLKNLHLNKKFHSL